MNDRQMSQSLWRVAEMRAGGRVDHFANGAGAGGDGGEDGVVAAGGVFGAAENVLGFGEPEGGGEEAALFLGRA